MTSFFAWNVRGFNMSRKHGAVHRWIMKEKPLFGCLMETRVREGNHRKCMKAALPGWSSITNYDQHRLGKIWFCWSDRVQVTMLHKSSQVITCVVQIPETKEQFICSAIYASNFEAERRELWEDMRGTQAAYKHLDMPWILLGDFNVTLSSGEHSRVRDYLTDQRGMRQFQEVVSDCVLTDLAYTGAIFTWWNKQDTDPIGKKLDRALINGAWLSAFPKSFAKFEAGGISDHARCVIQLSENREDVRKPFRFYNYLTEHEEFLPTVAKLWESTESLHHSPASLGMFHKKLKALKYEMRLMNKTHYGDLPARTRQAYEVMCDCQNQVLMDPNPMTFAAAAVASDRWNKLARIEEKFFRQKSCIRWLAAGDLNTAFFHRSVQSRASWNAIRQLQTENGEILNDPKAISREAVQHFQRFLQSQDLEVANDSTAILTELLTYRCDLHAASRLVAPVLPLEIQEAIHALPDDKVSGPDGYTKEFYVAAWPIIGRDFIVAVQSFFIYGFLPTGVNATILSLIPKTESAGTLKEYRPIACCNFLYKVISKILASRLKSILPEAIEANQCAFIKDRLLLENVLLATELVNGYHNRKNSDRCTIKFDISKAFDTVRWSFITDVLRAMGIPDLFVHWINVCISTAAFSVSVNGSLEGFFTSARGIRQGCSLSPYLYVIINNVLSKMLNQEAGTGLFEYHPQCQGVGLTHLSFADDILVFTKGTADSVKGVMLTMEKFAAMSGLHINSSKSSIYASGPSTETLREEALRLGIAVGSLPIRYLGLPLTTKALTKLDYEPLIDKIRSRMLSWTNKTLSFAGRLQLIKSVVFSIVNFWSSAFILPMGCLDDIESLCSAFLWSGSPNNSHKAKVKWDDLCYPKSEGGLGIRRLRDSVRVGALKLIWRLYTVSKSLWVSWIQHYLLRYSSFWDVRDDTTGSWMWRKILKMRNMAYQFIRVEVGNGNRAFFWHDDWLRIGKLIDITGATGTTYLGILRNAKVSEAVSEGRWKIRGQRNRHFHELHHRVQIEPVPNVANGPDKFLWRYDEGLYQDSFNAAKTWEQIRSKRPKVVWSRSVWFKQRIPRQAFLVWLAIQNRLSTGDRMRKWGINQGCVLCGERDETRDHLFFACPYSYTVWDRLASRLVGRRINPDWHDMLRYTQEGTANEMDMILTRLVFHAVVYNIWRERNTRRHQLGYQGTQQMIKTINRGIKNRITSLGYKFGHKFNGLLRRWFEVFD
ncbi:hypothetical protein YC2023_098313 [Brassica napus]